MAHFAGGALTNHLTAEDSNKDSHIEIYTEAEEGHDISPVSVELNYQN